MIHDASRANFVWKNHKLDEFFIGYAFYFPIHTEFIILNERLHWDAVNVDDGRWSLDLRYTNALMEIFPNRDVYSQLCIQHWKKVLNFMFFFHFWVIIFTFLSWKHPEQKVKYWMKCNLPGIILYLVENDFRMDRDNADSWAACKTSKAKVNLFNWKTVKNLNKFQWNL